jgi:glycine C-acetyltransferase
LDELNHASIIDGSRLSGARIVRFAHANAADLERQIQANAGSYRRALTVTDGVFSMDGDIAPLDEIYAVTERHDILLMVDDAHGEGVMGTGGRGIVDHFRLHGKVDVEVGTLSRPSRRRGRGRRQSRYRGMLRQRGGPSCSRQPLPRRMWPP